jgi:hypothetical protein
MEVREILRKFEKWKKDEFIDTLYDRNQVSFLDDLTRERHSRTIAENYVKGYVEGHITIQVKTKAKAKAKVDMIYTARELFLEGVTYGTILKTTKLETRILDVLDEAIKAETVAKSKAEMIEAARLLFNKNVDIITVRRVTKLERKELESIRDET